MAALFRVIIDFIRILYRGIKSVYARFYQSLKLLVLRLPLHERVFLLLMLSSGFLLTRNWRSYEIEFESIGAVDHGILTDDFLLYVIFHTVTVFPVLIRLSYRELEKVHYNWAIVLRTGGLAVITLFYVLTIIYPSRVAPTDEASFTVYFYLFGVFLLAEWVTGILGIKNYAQNSLRN